MEERLYSEIMEDFDAYDNRALRETVVDGMPKFSFITMRNIIRRITC